MDRDDLELDKLEQEDADERLERMAYATANDPDDAKEVSAWPHQMSS